MTPTHASVSVLHVAEAPSRISWRRLQVDLRAVGPAEAPDAAEDRDVALLELEAEPCLALLERLRLACPKLALVAWVREADPRAAARLSAAGADEVLAGEAPPEAIECGLRAGLDRRQSAIAAMEAEQRLRRTERALEEVVSAASHELRSPLSVIIGFSGLLTSDLRTELGPQAVEPTRKILRAAERLEALIRDVVLYGRLERDQAPQRVVEAGVCAQLAVEDLGAEIHAAGAKIELLPMPSCMGDPNFIQQIFAELIRNALRFRGPAAPRVRVGGERGELRSTYWVRDDGPGFDPRHKNEVFRLFRRLAPRTSETRGDGLGLALCRRMVELMDGEMGLETAPSQGVRVWFSLPAGE